jgi:hypothetical protein
MFIEYRGTFVRANHGHSCESMESLWLLAKNKSVNHVEHLVKMVVASKMYQCSYNPKHEKELSKINDLGFD